jgi:hypothetical protein
VSSPLFNLMESHDKLVGAANCALLSYVERYQLNQLNDHEKLVLRDLYKALRDAGQDVSGDVEFAYEAIEYEFEELERKVNGP